MSVVTFTGILSIVLPGGTIRVPHGFQYTLLTRGNDIRRQPGITVQDALNNSPNSCTFRVDGQSNVPATGEQIQIVDAFDSDRLLFAGNVQNVDQVYEDDTANLAWDCHAIDFTGLLNRRRPYGSYVNISVTEIVKDLIAKYAPGFSAAHVQTNLAKITIDFDGSEDFSSALTRMAQAIGGGHWYVDYVQDMHFFHRKSPNFTLPSEPPSVLRLGPGTSPVVSIGHVLPTSQQYGPCFVVFRESYVYSNGIESALGPCSDFLALDGTRSIQFNTLPLGTPAGLLTCTKRRVYYRAFGPNSAQGGSNSLMVTGKWTKGFEIADNTTATLTDANGMSLYFALGGVFPGSHYLQGSGTSMVSSNAPDPFQPKVAPPVNQAPPMTVVPPTGTVVYDNGSATSLDGFDNQNLIVPQPELGGVAGGGPIFGGTGYIGGPYQFFVTNFYRDGTESLPNAVDGFNYYSFAVNGIFRHDSNGVIYEVGITSSFPASNIPIGQTINGVDVIGRFIYAHYLGRGGTFPAAIMPVFSSMWWLLPNNTQTEIAAFGPSTFGSNVPATDLPTSPLPQWPNPDGPSLEDGNPPDDIDDLNEDLLRDPPFTSSEDSSQIRNRITVKGPATTLTVLAKVGDTVIHVADTSIFAPNGGSIIAKSVPIPYFGVISGNITDPSGTIYLSSPLPFDLPQGQSVNNVIQVDSVESQIERGKIELDKDGNPTDGVHEFPIDDGSLITPLQMYLRGMAELELFAFPIRTIKFSSRDPKLRSGQMVHVDLTHPPCHGDFLIQTVTIDQIHDDSDQLLPRYNVTASSVRFELNDLLLQIFKQSTSGGSSAAGLVPSATPSAPIVGQSGYGFATFSGGTFAIFTSTPLTITLTASSLVASQPQGKFDSRGMFALAGVGATGGSNPIASVGSQFSAPGLRPKVTWQLLMPTTAEMDLQYQDPTTGSRVCQMAIGLCVSALSIGLPTAVRGIYVYLDGAHATTALRSTWILRVIDSLGVAVDTPLVAARQDTRYDITIEADNDSKSKYIVTINGAETRVVANFNGGDNFLFSSTIRTLVNGVNSIIWVKRVDWQSS